MDRELVEDNIKLTYNVHGFILEVKVREGNLKVLYKDKCNVKNKKKMKNIFDILKLKFDIDIAKVIGETEGTEEREWFPPE